MRATAYLAGKQVCCCLYLPFTSGKMRPDGCALSERMVTVAFW